MSWTFSLLADNVPRSPGISHLSPTIQWDPLVIDTPLRCSLLQFHRNFSFPFVPCCIRLSPAAGDTHAPRPPPSPASPARPYPSRATCNSLPPSPATSRVLLRARLRTPQERGRHGRGTGAGIQRRQEVPSASPPYSFSHFYRFVSPLGSVGAPRLQGFRVYRCRWGFAAAAAAPGRPLAAGDLETAPKPNKLQSQR